MHNVMANQYLYSEFSDARDYSTPASGINTNTMQWAKYSKSCWETIYEYYPLVTIPVGRNSGKKNNMTSSAIIDIIESSYGDVVDTDRDGVPDISDEFPDNSNEIIDSDKDGIGNNADSDDDNDKYNDTIEIACDSNPNDSHEMPLDTDLDYIPNFFDSDDDNDGYTDEKEKDEGTNPIDSNSKPIAEPPKEQQKGTSPEGKGYVIGVIVGIIILLAIVLIILRRKKKKKSNDEI